METLDFHIAEAKMDLRATRREVHSEMREWYKELRGEPNTADLEHQAEAIACEAELRRQIKAMEKQRRRYSSSTSS